MSVSREGGVEKKRETHAKARSREEKKERRKEEEMERWRRNDHAATLLAFSSSRLRAFACPIPPSSRETIAPSRVSAYFQETL